MKVTLDNAQSGGPCITILGEGNIILTQLRFCIDGVLINGEVAKISDGILLYNSDKGVIEFPEDKL
ncbi:MAG: hypothetical protein KAS32_05310 [Candidatus Peribacteraceae bacterium]|nr:hypothetical protein [Candidatus Peribacteraceae bacterium]